MNEEGGTPCELSELYRELQLLRLKYDQLVNVCRKFTESWPNRGRDGRLLKATDASKMEEKKKNSVQTAEPSTVVAETTKTDGAISDENYDSPELKILDSILKKAQKIKLSDEEPKERNDKPARKRFATESCKKAAKVYQAGARKPSKDANPSSITTSHADHRPKKKSSAPRTVIGSKTTPRPVAGVTSDTPSSLKSRSETVLPVVAVVRHKGGGAETKRKGSPVSLLAPRRLENASETMEVASSTTKSLTTSSVTHEDAEEDEETQFQLSRDGSKLRMPSKYTALQTTILKFQDQISSQTTTDPSTAAMKEHFVNRLLPKGSCVSHRALQLELARQEYKLLTDEAKSLLGGEADVTSAREKLETIVNRASAVEDKVAITDSRQQQNATVDKTNQETSSSRDASSLRTRYSSWEERSTLRTPDNGPLVYSTLAELLQLVEAENRLRMARIETQLLKFCTEVVLPKYQLNQHQELSTTSVQILSELAGRPKPIFIRDD